jgi:hypothetical protein
MRGSSVQQSFATLKKIYLGALLMNWRIWTVTQWLSFHYIPPHFRVLWGKLNYINYKKATVLVTFIYLYLLTVYKGNCVALWWNAYLSLAQK